jgi:catechol 2,3-dioxygenase-like lactoylglutathione lyase family enzyme
MEKNEIPEITRVLETALYVDDLSRASEFYREVFGFSALVETSRLCALNVGGLSVLLLFQRGTTVTGLETDSGWIPPHDGRGPAHFALAIERDDVETWKAHLEKRAIAIESVVTWERGGTSIYFRDPEGHSVELVTRGTWATF